MTLLLIRTEYGADGTNGSFYINDKFICHSIELPWKNNQRYVSCIPEGRYELRKRYSDSFGWHAAVKNVPGRDAILIHSFNNSLKESRGCIAPVQHLQSPGCGYGSKAALADVMAFLKREQQPVYLEIRKTG